MSKNKWKNRFIVWNSICLFAVCCFSCSDEEKELEKPANKTVGALTQKVNLFMVKMMSHDYLWTKTVDWKALDYKTEADSYLLLKKIKHKDDRWSMLTDRVSELKNAFQGVSKTFGYQLIFGRFTNRDALFAIVLYVYPDTPADKAGLKRGDLLIALNGSDITEANYEQLYKAPSLSLRRGIFKEGKIHADPTALSLTAVSMYEDPILKDTVLVKGSNKIGYLCYSDYTKDSEARLLEIFSDFKAKGVTDVVLDLRYNGGGTATTSRLLCSILAPASAVKNKSKMLLQVWNDNYMAYWKKKGYENQLYERFVDTLAVNMDLKRLYVLTSRRTASASESTITALHPYLNLFQIGDTTSGKFCGGILVSPEDLWKNGEGNDIKNWGIYMMVYKFANVNHDEFVNGIVPKYIEKEDYFALYPHGDERDPLLGRALSLITGKPFVKMKSAENIPSYTVVPLEDFRPLSGKMISPVPSRLKERL